MEVPNQEYQVSPERQSIWFPGVANARQLGGYITENGRKVKADVLYRTGMLMTSEITADEMKDRLRLAKVIDFRTDAEQEDMPDTLTEGIEYIPIDISPKEYMLAIYDKYKLPESDVHYEDKNLEEMKKMDYNKCQEEIYRFYALHPAARKGYREFFDVLLQHDPKQGAVLFHCYQGKDRTGIAAVLLLTALGVKEEIIIQDYMMTNTMMRKQIFATLQRARKELCTVDAMRALSRLDGVELAMLETYLGTIEKEYGSVRDYLRIGLELSEADIDKLKELYTE